MVKTRGNTGRSGQNRWGDSWPSTGRISGRPWGIPMAANGENLMATHKAVSTDSRRRIRNHVHNESVAPTGRRVRAAQVDSRGRLSRTTGHATRSPRLSVKTDRLPALRTKLIESIRPQLSRPLLDFPPPPKAGPPDTPSAASAEDPASNAFVKSGSLRNSGPVGHRWNGAQLMAAAAVRSPGPDRARYEFVGPAQAARDKGDRTNILRKGSSISVQLSGKDRPA